MNANLIHKAIRLAAVLLCALLTATACAQYSGTAAQTEPEQTGRQEIVATATAQITDTMEVYQVITAQKAKLMIDQNPDITIVDVREPSEYAQGHLPNAKLLPLGSIEQMAATALPDKGATILVYCRSGRRSQAAARALIALGYTQVFDIGGIISWPYDVVKN